MQMKIMEQKKEREDQQMKRAYLLNRSKEYKQKQSELLEKIRYLTIPIFVQTLFIINFFSHLQTFKKAL